MPPLNHLIIDKKNRELIKQLADQSLEMEDVHDAFEAMPTSNQTQIDAKNVVATMIDTHSDNLADAASNLAGEFNAIKTAVGL